MACGTSPPSEPALQLSRRAQAFINGGDDRREYFELTEDQRGALQQFTVALMTGGAAEALLDGDLGALPTWGEADQLCDDQPFVNQPSAAFCSGVLLDWDLVLTSGHCVSAVPLSELRVVFGYYYETPGELALSKPDVYQPARVVASRRDEAAAGERLDFAWLQLKSMAQAPHRPAAAYTRSSGARERAPVISIGAGGGVPLKWDQGAEVQDTRPGFDDYFVANTDTSQGSSGGGIFDERLAVLGSLARGAPDFTRTSEGCYVTNTEPDPDAAQEQFTYVHRAVAALCEAGSDSVLCDPACDEPCGSDQPTLELRAGDDGGCSLAPRDARRHLPAALTLAALTGLVLARRGRVRARRS